MSFLLPTGENRKILHEQEAEKMLIILLAHESPDVQAAAAQAIGVMCENLSCRDSIREWGEFVVSHFSGHCHDFIKGEPKWWSLKGPVNRNGIRNKHRAVLH